MVDRWAARLARVDRAIDRRMSETLRVVPVVEGDFGDRVDEERETFEVDGVLTIKRGETDLGGNREHIRNSLVRAGKAEAQITRSLLPPGAEILKNDRIIAVAKGLVWKIERVDTEHPGRLALELSIDGAWSIA